MHMNNRKLKQFHKCNTAHSVSLNFSKVTDCSFNLKTLKGIVDPCVLQCALSPKPYISFSLCSPNCEPTVYTAILKTEIMFL